jgi:hypothetical protein
MENGEWKRMENGELSWFPFSILISPFSSILNFQFSFRGCYTPLVHNRITTNAER